MVTSQFQLPDEVAEMHRTYQPILTLIEHVNQLAIQLAISGPSRLIPSGYSLKRVEVTTALVSAVFRCDAWPAGMPI